MVDWSRWLPGLPDDDPETDDPVQRTLATLGQPSYDPRYADEGPHEQPYPGTVSPIINPDGSRTTERSITVTEPELNAGRATNIPTVWSGAVVTDDEAIQNAAYSRRDFPAYDSIDEAVSAAEQRSRDLGAGGTSIGGAVPFAPGPSAAPAAPPYQPLLDASSAIGTAARGWLDDAIAGAPTLLPTPPPSPPSYAPRRLEPGEPSMLEQLPAVASEYGRAASEALGDRGALLAGMRPPETPEEVVAANAPAPFRAVRAASEIGSAAGSAALGEFGARAAGDAPTFTTNEITTPFGTIPSVEGPTPRQVGSAMGSVVGDPTSLILPGTAADRAAGVAVENLAGAAGRAVSGPVKRTLGALGEALESNAGRVAAADVRMAAEGGTQLPGTLGVITDNPLEAGRATRSRVVPPEVADTLDFPVRIPEDPATIRAIEAAGGSIDPERGTTLHVIRNHDPEAAGGEATRDAVFYIAGPPGAPNPYAKNTPAGAAGVGGPQRVEGWTRFRSPLFIEAAPGEARGFDDGMRQLAGADQRAIDAAQAEITRLDHLATEIDAKMQAAARRGEPTEALQQQYNAASDAGGDAYDRWRALQKDVPTANQVEYGIAAAKRAGPAGSPERAQALKDLVTKYGGNPDRIDALMALRGADMGESVFAVKENILAANARAKGYDGVITVMPRTPVPDEIAKHPAVKAAEAERFEIQRRLGQITREIDERYATLGPEPEEGAFLKDPKIAGLVDEYNQVYARRDQMPQVMEEARNQAYRELSTGKITELMDPREARNPTPGAPNPKIAVAEAAYQAARERYDALNASAAPRLRQASMRGDDAAHGAILRELDEAASARDVASEQLGRMRGVEPPTTPPGYALRSDIARRPAPTRDETTEQAARLSAEYRHLLDEMGAVPPGSPEHLRMERQARKISERLDEINDTLAEDAPTPNLRSSTIVENPRIAAARQAYEAADARLNAAYEARDAATAAHQSQANAANWKAYQAAEDEMAAAREAWTTAGRAFDEAQVQGRYVTDAQSALGVLPASRRTTDRLSAVNRALGQGVASSVSGGVGAQINQQMNPDDPYAGVKGFAAGAIAPYAITKGVRGALRAAGRGGDELAGGARIALGDVPPSRVNQVGLPGIEHPPYVKPDLPAVSEAPNRAPVLGNVPPSNIRTPGLPGFEPPRPGPLTGDLIPGAPPAARTPSRVAPSGTHAIGEALPDIIRALNTPPAAAAREGASLPLSAEQSGVVPRIRDALAGLASSTLNKVQTLRVAGMLSDTAGQIANVASGPVSQAIDVATGPIAAALDVGRVGMLRAAGKQADRQVFFGETAQRLQGMRAGAGIGLGRAVDVLKGGLDAGEAAKLEQRGGFGTNIPGLAPKGSAQAGAVDFAVEAPLRALGAADAVFKTSAQGGHLMAEAYAAARRANGGRVPTPEMVREAAKLPEVLDRVNYLSSRSVLQEDRTLTSWYKRAMNYRSSDPVEQAAADALKAGLAVEIPFVRTPYNVVAQGMGMSPVGLLGVVQDVKQGKAAREVEQRLARVMLGTAVMAPVAAGVANGEYTGAYPDTEKERSLLPPGWRPWSRKIEAGGETYYLPLSYAGPLALPAVMAILGAEAYKKGGWSLETAGKVAAGVGQYAAQESFIDGFGEIAKLFDAKTGPATWERHAEQLAASYVPHIIGGGALGREIQRVMGMPARDPSSPLEAMQATLPYAAGNVEPRQDVLGREASLGAGGALGAVVRAGQEDDAAVLRAFRRGREGLPMSAPDSLPDPGTGRPRPLTERQQHRWRRVFGRELRTAWADAGAPSDAETLREVEAEARQAANETILGQR